MEELREAMVVEVGDTRLRPDHLDEPAFLVEECKSLITYDKSSGIIRFTHSTVQDFLQSTMHHTLLTEVDLAKTLLTYLSFDIFKLPCQYDTELKERIQVHKLCRYAARWWPEHARGQGERDVELQSLLFELFRRPSHTKSLLQIEAIGIELPAGIVTLLHFATFHRLTYICGILCSSDYPFTSSPSEIRGITSPHDLTDLSTIVTSIRQGTFGTVHSRDGFDETPLHIAARIGEKEIAKLFIGAGADLNATSGKSADLTPLHLAIIRGHNDIVDLLISNKAGLETKGGYWRETPRLLAAHMGRVEALEMLLKANANVTDTIEGVGETAIMWAIDSPNAIPVVRLLLRYGADINARDAQGRTAVHYALHMHSFKACREMLEFLLGEGANVNIHSTLTGDTPLHTAAKIHLQGRQYELNLRKAEHGFSKQLVNEVYARRWALERTPIPVHHNREDTIELAGIVKLLLRWHADQTAKNFNGSTPLQCAIKVRNPAVAYILLWASGGKVEFTMDSMGEQEFLEAMVREVKEGTANEK